jgi:isoquinoline 1-oxidoreductase subunit beta
MPVYFRDREVAATASQVSSIEAWPAGGGGLLLGMMVTPAWSGTASTRHPIKNLFLRINTYDLPTAIVPYVRLEREVADCASQVIAEELGITAAEVAIDNPAIDLESGGTRTIVDLCPAAELGLALIAAAGRGLLKAAAAEIWGIPLRDCVTERGMVRGSSRQRTSYADLAADAALLDLPGIVTLTSGRPIALRRAHG